MFWRYLLQDIQNWKADSSRKPLILRGARQTGKTTLVKMLAEGFDSFLPLNLELSTDRRNWEGNPSIEELLRNIEITKNIKIVPGKTLLFLDEIQNEPKAIQSLRYFYEQKPDLHVIASGSLLEVALKQKGFSFPVGRVSFLYLHPFRFDEFLLALGKNELLEELNTTQPSSEIQASTHSFATEQFKDYLYTGGMPEAVKIEAEKKGEAALKSLQGAILASFEEDVPKYATRAQVPYVQFLIQQAPLFAGQRIQYANFANSNYRSREIRWAFDTLEKAMIVQRIPGNTQVTPPMQPNFRIAPKLIYLDTGLVSRKLNLDRLSLKTSEDLNGLFRGTVSEQVVGQTLLAQESITREAPSFWCRNQPGSTAEVDYCISFGGKIIPIEVKSGKTGTLRSLLQFMDQAPHPYAVRIYSGPLQMDSLITPGGKKFSLLSLPFYLTYRIKKILENWIT